MMKYRILLIVFSVCLVASAILSVIPPSNVCGANNSGCSIVNNSKYGKTFGVRNSYWGIFAFTVLISLTISQLVKPNKKKENFIALGIILGSIVAIYFIYLQLFVIKAYCKYCMVVDIGILFALAIIVVDRLFQLRWK
ncbi:vitamin K epoxide reductase family protein [Candidatus Pacearchaeota archaeon]|nr:MAG: vitamin K epoxide reductase family protein [Candidatus Pacearchaeota archaeon]